MPPHLLREFPNFTGNGILRKKGGKTFTGNLPFEQVVESKKCLDGQKRSSALLARVCCCLLCISNLPWASRPTPLKTFEQLPFAGRHMGVAVVLS
jgi:hypothetical protein